MLMIGALVALAQVAAPAPGAAGNARARGDCSAVLVTSPQQPASARSRGTFSATRILNLHFGTVLRRRPKDPQLLELKVYTPRGHLYQTLSVPFTAGRSRERRVEGYTRPIQEQEMKPVSYEGARAYEVSATLPVGGTAIMSNSLYGSWRVEPHLDGALCGPSAQFQITP